MGCQLSAFSLNPFDSGTASGTKMLVAAESGSPRGVS